MQGDGGPCVRLYTGPAFVKYNAILRGVVSSVPFFKTTFENLTLGINPILL